MKQTKTKNDQKKTKIPTNNVVYEIRKHIQK